MGMTTCSVVVPIWGDPALTDQCLIELNRTAPDAEVIAIDNTGVYQPPDGVKCTLVAMPTNVGCATAKAFGAAMSDKDVVITMDCDAFPNDGWLDPLLAVFDNELVGMAGPRIIDRAGNLQCACIRTYHGNGSAGGENRLDEHLANDEEDGATGACMAIRRTALLEIPFDIANFNTTYDDVDLSLQFREAGWRIAYVPQSSVTHGSVSTGPERWVGVHDVIARMNSKWGNR